MTDKHAMLRAERAMRRLHALLSPITITEGRPYYNGDTKVLDSPNAEWAKAQLEKFHRALTTGVVFAETTRQATQEVKK